MTTTRNLDNVTAEVRAAIEDIVRDFEPTEIEVSPDGQGGARVRFGPVSLGKQYKQRETWMGGHLTAQIPYADVYPVFVRGDLERNDGKQLVRPLTSGHSYMGVSAVQASRRSNNRDASIETPKLKFKKVLEWVNSQ